MTNDECRMTKEGEHGTDYSRLCEGYSEGFREQAASGSESATARREVSGRRIEHRGRKTATPCSSLHAPRLEIALLTGGDDKPYVVGLVEALTASGVVVDVIGSDDLSVPELLNNPRVNFLNLRGDQSSKASLVKKVERVITYYCRLFRYSATAKPKIFHILWNNKFEVFDRTLLILYYKLAGKRIVLTAHNVNIRSRDGSDNWLNRCSLRIQYQLTDRIFVHTEKMKTQLVTGFGVAEGKVSVTKFIGNKSND